LKNDGGTRVIINSTVEREVRYVFVCAAVSGVLVLMAAWAGRLVLPFPEGPDETDPELTIAAFIAP
jgi:hypothetical protein